MPGTLYVVATPIGNLGDLSERARTVLATVATIACEDTRVTRRLLQRFRIRTPSVSYHEHNEEERSRELLLRLQEGSDVALVSDAGTPLVSDPGYRLVRAAREHGIEVRAIPGPSALLAALAISGLPTSRFTFAGFLPPKGRARETAIQSLSGIEHTLVLFEAGTRITRLLAELALALGPRPALVLREMTKLHEEHLSGTLPELARLAGDRSFRGEVTLVVGGTDSSAAERALAPPSASELEPRFRELRHAGLSAKEAAKQIARESGLGARVVYNELAGKRRPART
jgi:16S rRNA (cytidine1402-2'-O)-methyltransferase